MRVFKPLLFVSCIYTQVLCRIQYLVYLSYKFILFKVLFMRLIKEFFYTSDRNVYIKLVMNCYSLKFCNRLPL